MEGGVILTVEDEASFAVGAVSGGTLGVPVTGVAEGGGTWFAGALAGPLRRTVGWLRTGGALATEESITTTFPPPAFFTGCVEIVNGARGAAAPPGDGEAGLGVPSGAGVLSGGIILGALVNAKYRQRCPR
jgi:hypothetical protein